MYLRLSKKGFAFFDKRIAVCRAHDLYALAYKSHTCSLSCIFCQVQEVNCPEGARETPLGCAPTENDQNPFAACGRQTLRGFFDTLYFWFFKLKKWGKKTAETRRRNCAVLP